MKVEYSQQNPFIRITDAVSRTCIWFDCQLFIVVSITDRSLASSHLTSGTPLINPCRFVRRRICWGVKHHCSVDGPRRSKGPLLLVNLAILLNVTCYLVSACTGHPVRHLYRSRDKQQHSRKQLEAPRTIISTSTWRLHRQASQDTTVASWIFLTYCAVLKSK